MKNPKYSMAMIAAGLLMVFAVQNMATVELNFLFWSFHSNRFLMILMAVFIGFFIGWAFGSRKKADHNGKAEHQQDD